MDVDEPDGSTRNEIDYIMSTKRYLHCTRIQLFSDVSVINRLKAGSDHHIDKWRIKYEHKAEKDSLGEVYAPTYSFAYPKPESFQLEFQNRFACLEDCASMDDLYGGWVYVL